MCGLLSGCAATADLRDHQKVETQALRDYHKAERKVVLADEAINEAQKVSNGALVAAHAVKALAVVEREAAFRNLNKELNGKKEGEPDAQD